MSIRSRQPAPRPWYREPWVWALMLPPAAAVAGGSTLLYLAIETPHALVVDDYADIEALTAARFERDVAAVRQGIEAELLFGDADGLIEAHLEAPGDFVPPPELELGLRHASDPAADRKLTLVRQGNAYRGRAELARGRYFIELMPPDASWRLGSGAVRPAGQIALHPQSAGG